MLHHLRGGGAVILQHVLDQINPATGAIELITQQGVCGTGGGAEAAMHATTQNLLGGGDVRVGQLRRGKIGLHGG